MVTRVFRSVVIGYNKFNPKKAMVGWVNEKEVCAHDVYHTSEFIEVIPGDTVYFGAAAIPQGWHIVTYTPKKQGIRRVALNDGVRVFQALDDFSAILQYRVEEGVRFVRVICDTRYLNSFLVTINRGITAGEYRKLMQEGTEGSVTRMEEQTLGQWTVVLNQTGRGKMTIGQTTTVFEPNTVVCVPPGVPFVKKSDRGFSDILVQTDSFLLEEQLENEWAVIPDDKNSSLETLISLMLRTFLDGDEAYSGRLLEQLFHTVELLLFHRLQEEHPRSHQINRMVEIIGSGFTNPDFSLDEIFKDQNYCPNHLRRLFKEKMGCTPVEYLTDLRIGYAKKRMEDKEMQTASVSQIALMSGFRDPCYFSRVFKKKTGVSPAEYMKKTKE